MSYKGKGVENSYATDIGEGYSSAFLSYNNYVVGQRYPIADLSSSSNNYSLTKSTQDLIFCIPYYFRETCTIDEIRIRIGIAASSGKSARLGLYNTDGIVCTTLNRDFGTVPIDATGTITKSVSETIVAGLYFFALLLEEDCAPFSFIQYYLVLPNSSYQLPSRNGNLIYAQSYASGFPDLTAVTPTLLSGTSNTEMRNPFYMDFRIA